MGEAWGDVRADRYWCLRDAAVHLDEDGFLGEPGGWFGSAANPSVVTVDALKEPRCVVIIGEPGEPGVGKSETVRLHAPLVDDGSMPIVTIDLAEYGTEDRLLRALVDSSEVVAWRAGMGKLCVVLDSLDECQDRLSHVATVLSLELARWPTERLFLRICCRTGDWPEGLQQQLERLFPGVYVYELLPLTRANVIALADAGGVNGNEFLVAVRRAHVGPLAAKPLTLEMLLRLYQRDGRLPEDVSGLYREALLLLSDEPTQRRRDAQPAGRLAPGDRLAVAARLAALLTFAQRAAIWTGRADECGDTDLSVRECAGGSEPGATGDVRLSEDAVRETLRAGLFSSRGAARMGWAHQTFAEYLTARFVIAHELSEKQLHSLLVAADGEVYPQLRPVAAWLMSLSGGEFDWLAEQDPELLLTAPIDVARPALRERAVAGLFRMARAGDYRPRFGHRFGGLDFPHLDQVVRDRLQLGTPEERGLALEIAGGCPLPKLSDELVGIVLDDGEDYRIRVSAAHALTTIPDQVSSAELLKVATAPTGDDDPDDELKGVALRLSWPHVLTTPDTFGALTPPRRSNLLGAYAMFVQYEFPDALTLAEVDSALDWLLAVERSVGRHDRFDLLADRVVTLALGAVEDPTIADRLAQLILLRSAAHEPLFVDHVSRESKPILTAEQRHRIIEAVLPRIVSDDAIGLIAYTDYGPGLVTRDDLAWLIARFDEDVAHREVLARFIELVFHPSLPGHARIVLDLPEDHLLRSGSLRYWLTTVDLASEEAIGARERHRLVTGDEDRHNEKEPPPTDAEVESRIESWLGRFDDGDSAGFWQACALLYLRPGARFVRGGEEFDPDLTAQPRWGALSANLRDRLTAAAREYLDVGDCAAEAWLGSDTLHRAAYAGYRALILLRRLNLDAILALPPEVWQRWAPILVAAAVAHGAGDWEDKHSLLDLARPHAEDELLAAAITIIEQDSARGERIGCDRELVALWSPRLADWLREAVTNGRLSARAAADATALLAEHDPPGARHFLHEILDDDSDEDRRARAGALLLAHDAEPSWSVLHRVLLQKPELGDRIVTAYVSDIRYDELPGLSDDHLADLYVWLVRRFPFAEDPEFDDVHAVGTREQLAHWRDRVLRTLSQRGTASAVEAVRRIEVALPEYPWLRGFRLDAELQLRAAAFEPTAASELLALVEIPDRRLVKTNDHLSDVVVEAFEAVQKRLIGETPESHLLWDTRSGRPKAEEDISDYLRNRLQDLLVTRRAIVSREVQVRRSGRGIGERTDIRVDAVSASRDLAVLTVVVEVKGAWNARLVEDLQDQLVDRYMADIGTAHGIYVVAWPDLSSWRDGDRNRSVVAARQHTTVRDDLHRQVEELATRGTHVAVLHLDIALSRPPPSGP